MMKYIFCLLGVAMLTACSGASPSATPTVLTAAPTPPATGGADNAVFGNLLNNVRLANGAGTVAFDARLSQAAQAHATDMLTNGFFDHTGSDGSSVGDRATAAGYNWTTIGENIARGQQSESEVMTDWTNSPGHHANNINPAFQDFALSQAGSGADLYWVLVLGAE